MKRLTMMFMILLLFSLVLIHDVFATSYCSDFLEPGNPGGWGTSLKTWDGDFTISSDETVVVDIWINEVPSAATAGGFWLDFRKSIDLISLTDAKPYVPEPWSPGGANVSQPNGPGTHMVIVPNLAGANPDVDGDIIIARLAFECLDAGVATIKISTVMGVPTWGPNPPWNDADIDPTTFAIICEGGDDSDECEEDTDCADGVFCNGREICVDGACEQGTDPCPGQVCDEYTNSCESTLTTTTTIKTISEDNSRSIFNEIPESSDDDYTRSVLNEMSGSSDITTTRTYGPTTTQKTSNLTTITESVKAPESITRISPKLNTTTLSSPYRVFISPSSVTINSGEMVLFRSKTIFDENGLKGKYRWKIDPASPIGSTIDENGILTAGINTADSALQETVWVTDIIHENTYATGTVTITGKKQLPPGCELSTSPSAATILPEDTIKIFAKNFGRKCLKGSYEWKIYSIIGSQISADGLYTAGNNDTGNSAIDIIIVKDSANNSSADSMITVLPSEKFARVTPDSTEKPQPEAVSRKGTYSKVLIVIIPITLLVIVTIGIVLFRKNKQ